MTDNLNANLDDLLNQHFAGKVVRKDLTKMIKEARMFPSMCWSICWACIAPRMTPR